MMNNGSSNGSLDRLTFNLHGSVKLSPQSVLNTPSNISVSSNNNHDTSSESVNSRRNKRKNFKPRNICVYDDNEDNEDAKSPDNVVSYPNDDDMISKQDDSLLIQDDDDEGDEDIDRRPVKRLRLDHRESMSSEGSSYSSPVNHASSMHTLIPEIDGNHFLLRGNNSNQNNNNPKNSVHSNNNHENVDENAGQSSSRCNASNNKSQFEALDLSQSQDNSKEGSCSGSPSPDDVASSLRDQQVFPTRTSSTSPSKDDSSRRPSLTPTSSQSTYNPFPSSMIGLDVDHHNLQYHRSPHSGLGSEKGSLGFWRPGVISGIAPWIDPVYLNQTGKKCSSKRGLLLFENKSCNTISFSKANVRSSKTIFRGNLSKTLFETILVLLVLLPRDEQSFFISLRDISFGRHCVLSTSMKKLIFLERPFGRGTLRSKLR